MGSGSDFSEGSEAGDDAAVSGGGAVTTGGQDTSPDVGIEPEGDRSRTGQGADGFVAVVEVKGGSGGNIDGGQVVDAVGGGELEGAALHED